MANLWRRRYRGNLGGKPGAASRGNRVSRKPVVTRYTPMGLTGDGRLGVGEVARKMIGVECARTHICFFGRFRNFRRHRSTPRRKGQKRRPVIPTSPGVSILPMRRRAQGDWWSAVTEGIDQAPSAVLLAGACSMPFDGPRSAFFGIPARIRTLLSPDRTPSFATAMSRLRPGLFDPKITYRALI